jgi:uncharacterized protein YdaU (DUF1376 family)
MHYYQHNIGDYRKDTAHLSILEHGIYRQLLDTYYLNELPLTIDLALLMRTHGIRTPEEIDSLKNVLNDFFDLAENGYFHKRCEEIIANFHGKSEKARLSARVRWDSMRPHSERNAKAMRTVCESDANHKPITNNQYKTITPPEGVDPIVFKDFITHRKSKKAPVTETAIKGIEREARKAGMTLQAAMEMCCSRGWTGFKAEWLDVKKTAGEKNSAVVSGLTRGLVGGLNANLLTN